ncbi:hypothetical protein, partial [uncultured Mailhella sp.]|uniref:hypothetical protein n=1 Tax=uncultured Mailhella sp. TaxID=1981031 RepID=UPI0025D808A8
IYLSPVGCQGIMRRKQERNLKINARLEEILLKIASTMSAEEIEKRSRVQKRGRFNAKEKSQITSVKKNQEKSKETFYQLSLLA